MRKQAAAFFLTVCMLLTPLPAQALAAELPVESAPVADVLPAEESAGETPPEEDVFPEDIPSEDVSPEEDVPTAEDVPPAEEEPGDVELKEDSAATGSGSWGSLSWVLDEAGTLTVSGAGEMPGDTPAGFPWSDRRSSIKKAVIGEGVTCVGPYAFSSCTDLESVTIPETAVSLGKGAFYGCASLTGVTIPKGVTAIDSSTFDGCASLTSVTIPDGLISIGAHAFSGCSSLESLTIPETVTTIEWDAFSKCAGLTSMKLPSGVKEVPSSLFSGCSKLERVELSDTVTAIGLSAFENCAKLKEITIPETVTSIGSRAFSGCAALTEVVIPDSVTDIEDFLFSGCAALTDVTLPKDAASIPRSFFQNCASLGTLKLPDGVTEIGMDAFNGCSKLTDLELPNGVTDIMGEAFNDCTALKSMTLPDSVTYLDYNAFSGCRSLERVEIPCGVTYLGRNLFSGAPSGIHVSYGGSRERWEKMAKDRSGLTSEAELTFGLQDASDIASYAVTGGSIYYDPSTGVVFACDESVTEAHIPGSINGVNLTAIGKGAFVDGENITRVTIEEGVTSIGHHAFFCDWRMTDLTLPSSAAAIGEAAFYGCRGLTGVTLPEGVAVLGESAFSSCENLEELWIPSTVKRIGNSAFFNCYALTNVTISEGVTEIGTNAFSVCRSLTGITIPTGVTTIGPAAFSQCSSLEEISIPATVTSIGNNMFSVCNNLKDIYFGGSQEAWEALVGQNTGISNPEDVEMHFNQEHQIVIVKSSLSGLSYSFSNQSNSFGYGQGYQIPLTQFIKVFGDTARARELQGAVGTWGGSCYGMSSTSALFARSGNGVSVRDYKSTASRPSALAVTDSNGARTLTEFIELMQISQNSTRIQQYWHEGLSIDEICKRFLESGKAPFVVDIWGAEGGHAMVAYDLVDVSNTESHLMVYDPNYPQTERYITIGKTGGSYSGWYYRSWYYHLNDQWDWGTGYPNARIAYISYSDFYGLWTDHPVPYSLSDSPAALSDEAKSALLILNTGDAEILDASGQAAATLKDGAIENPARDDIFVMRSTGITADGQTGGSEKTILFLPPDQYTVRETGANRSRQPFEATMVHVDQSATVTTSGGAITFAVDDEARLNYAEVSGPGAAFTVTLASTLGAGTAAEPETATVSGTVAEEGKTFIGQLSGGLYAENIPAEDIQVDNKPVDAGAVKDGSTLNVSAALRGLSAVLQADGCSAVLSNQVSGVRHVLAAAYKDGRMTDLSGGSVTETVIAFEKPVSRGSTLFLLDEKWVPLHKKITLE